MGRSTRRVQCTPDPKRSPLFALFLSFLRIDTKPVGASYTSRRSHRGILERAGAELRNEPGPASAVKRWGARDGAPIWITRIDPSRATGSLGEAMRSLARGHAIT